MPNRIIKESIHGSEKIQQLSDFQFRLWVGLITYVDDYGRGDARPAMIKGAVFPLRDRVTVKDIKSALLALAGAGCVGLYEVDGKPYLYFPNWEQHQRIQTKKPKYPGPDEATGSYGESPCVTVDHRESPPESESNTNPNTNPNTKSARTQFVPPTLDEVKDYCAERNSPVDPVQFFEYFSEGNWKDSKGNPVRNWKQKLITWEKFQPEKAKKTGTAAELEDSYDMLKRWANGQS